MANGDRFSQGVDPLSSLLDQSVSRLEELRDEEPERNLPMEPGGAKFKGFMDILLGSISTSAVRAGIDPIEAIGHRVQAANPARMFVHDLLAGWGSSMTGQPFRSAREIMLGQELAKAELRQARDDNFGSIINTMFDYASENRRTDQAARSDSITAASRVAAEAGRGFELERDREVGLELAEFRTEEAIREVEMERALGPFTVDDAEAEFAWKAVDQSATEEERAAADAQLKAIREQKMEALKESEEVKQAVQAKYGVDRENTTLIPFKQETPIGLEHQMLVVDKRTGQVRGRETLGFSTSDRSQEEKFNADKRQELLTEATTLVESIDETQRIELQAAAQGLIGRVRGLSGAEAENVINTMIKESGLELSSTQARLFQLMGRLTAETVVEFTGAQATDNERQFIKTTLPNLLQNKETFERGLEILRLHSEWSAARIRNNLYEPDAFGSMKLAERGAFFGQINQALESDKMTLDELKDMDASSVWASTIPGGDEGIVYDQ